jgi:hypothetical protein
MLKKIAAAALVAGSMALVATPASAVLCVEGEVTVNGTTQTISQCV